MSPTALGEQTSKVEKEADKIFEMKEKSKIQLHGCGSGLEGLTNFSVQSVVQCAGEWCRPTAGSPSENVLLNRTF